MALQAMVRRGDLYRVILQQAREGIYVFIFERATSPFPDRDYLQDDWEHAIGFCERKYSVPRDRWLEIPDQRIGSIRPAGREGLDYVAEQSDAPDLTADQKAELQRRLHRLEQTGPQGRPWAQVKKRLTRRHNP